MSIVASVASSMRGSRYVHDELADSAEPEPVKAEAGRR